MDLLKRDHAPITPEAWKQVDDEARRVLKLDLAGRKLVDFDGPYGWKQAAIDGAVLLSHRGGDFQLSVGQDLSIGYQGYVNGVAHLFLTESFTFRVLERSAAIYLKPRRGKK